MTKKVTVQVSRAIKAKIAKEIGAHMTKAGVSQSELARRMKTSRAVVHRVLNPRDTSMTLATLGKAAAALKAKVNVTIAA